MVANGGWFALEQKATAELGASNFAQLKPQLDMSKIDLVELGGWHVLETLAADPKGVLRNILRQQQQNDNHNVARTTKDDPNAAQLDAIVSLLAALGKGYDAELLDGDWRLVLQRQGKKSPRVQQLVGRVEKMGKTENVFNVAKLQFKGTALLFGAAWALVSSTVQYRPVAAGFTTTRDHKIVLRRIACDIVKAFIKIWKLPGLPLPFLKRKGGFLDFWYLDKDLRVTSGNRGGLFVHARPEYVQEELL